MNLVNIVRDKKLVYKDFLYFFFLVEVSNYAEKKQVTSFTEY